jgi:hypothetical protein
MVLAVHLLRGQLLRASVSSDRRAQSCPRQTYLGDDLRFIFDPQRGRLTMPANKFQQTYRRSRILSSLAQ